MVDRFIELREWMDYPMVECMAYYQRVLKEAKLKDGNNPDKPAQIALARFLGKTDLFFLMVYILKRKDMVKPWLYERCREVQAQPDGHLDLWAREHYKSTIITFGLTIFDVLNNPEITVGLFSHTRPNSKKFLAQIMQEFESNELLKKVFSDVLWEHPRKQAPKWSEDEGITVKRKDNPKEATIEAWGLVEGMPTGRHFSHRIYDDVVTEKSVTTPEMIAKTTQRWELSDNLGKEGGVERYIGTRYFVLDTYNEMIKRGVVKLRKRPCTSDGSEDFSKAVLMSPQTLAEKRKKQGMYTFSAQMLLDPTADKSMGFKEDWFRFWDCNSWANLKLVILVDPASKQKKESDYTAMLVIGKGGDDCYYIVDIVHDKLSLSGRRDALFDLHRKYRPKKGRLVVGYEEYGAQADIDYFKIVMEQQTYDIPIIPLGGAVAKDDRIRRLVPIVEAGQLFLPRRVVRPNFDGAATNMAQSLLTQFTTFPVGGKDLIDCCARLMDSEIQQLFNNAPAPDKKPDYLRQIARKQRREAGAFAG